MTESVSWTKPDHVNPDLAPSPLGPLAEAAIVNGGATVSTAFVRTAGGMAQAIAYDAPAAADLAGLPRTGR